MREKKHDIKWVYHLVFCVGIEALLNLVRDEVFSYSYDA